MSLIDHISVPRAAITKRNGPRHAAFRRGSAGWVAAPVATVVLALLTGLPARSVPNLLPHSDDRAGISFGF